MKTRQWLSQANKKPSTKKAIEYKEKTFRSTTLELRNKALSEENFFRSILTGCDLTGTALRHANLEEATLIGTTLTRTDLQGANLNKAKLTNAGFFSTKLQGARLNNTILGDFEPNHSLKSYKNSKQTNAVFFNTLNDIPTELDRLNRECTQNTPQSTLQAMVAHSLINQLAKAPTDEVIPLLAQYKDHDFFNGFDWAAHTPSFIRGLTQDTARGMGTQLTPTKMALSAYFLIQQPKLTTHLTDLLHFFTTKERKTALITAIESNQALRNSLDLDKLQNNDTALTQILNTRRHLFHTERKPNQTASSKQLFSLFRSSSNFTESSDSSMRIRLKPKD